LEKLLMKFNESIADYVAYWKAGDQEQEQHEKRQIENESTKEPLEEQ
jgi:hypothetical protein